MPTKVGTSHFRDVNAAMNYYNRQGYGYTIVIINQMIKNGEIHIGKPELKPGQRVVLIDGATRYAIIEDE